MVRPLRDVRRVRLARLQGATEIDDCAETSHIDEAIFVDGIVESDEGGGQVTRVVEIVKCGGTAEMVCIVDLVGDRIEMVGVACWGCVVI